jgi:hypothetical protein
VVGDHARHRVGRPARREADDDGDEDLLSRTAIFCISTVSLELAEF